MEVLLQMKLPHAIEFKPDGTRMFVTTNKDPESGQSINTINYCLGYFYIRYEIRFE